ncbi:hypothetical protein L1987_01106 [Smallanthus sonchifolius]|uniref:Uncharacterized protein n=1 Tax=Smallanthus sonchifolius TaxID=185202 RepID=A0ACB9K4C6_9ASTR|nr:hypothetical protein L1987_01106 [Smallanthus sonchifolius]
MKVVKVLLEPMITPEILQQNPVKGEYKAKKEIALNRAAEDACGNVVVSYASLHQDIKTVINLSGRYKIERGMEERLGKVYLERPKKDGFIDIKSKTGYCPFIDQLMKSFKLKMLWSLPKIIPNHDLRIIQGANHSYTDNKDELVYVVLDFLKHNLHRA